MDDFFKWLLPHGLGIRACITLLLVVTLCFSFVSLARHLEQGVRDKIAGDLSTAFISLTATAAGFFFRDRSINGEAKGPKSEPTPPGA